MYQLGYLSLLVHKKCLKPAITRAQNSAIWVLINYAMGVALGQRTDKVFRVIYYASKTFNEAQENYSTTENEMLAIVFACEKFRPYILWSRIIIHTDLA